MFGLPDAYGFRALGRHGDKGLESITATGLRGKYQTTKSPYFAAVIQSSRLLLAAVVFHHCKQKATATTKV
jgi:hypothetical protein